MKKKVLFTAIVLAGARPSGDPVAELAGVESKASVKVAGISMLDRVVTTLSHSEWVGNIIISGVTRAAVASAGNEGCLSIDGVVYLQGEETPSRSVVKILEDHEDLHPFLLVTADHPLLTTEMIESFCCAAVKGGDVVVGVVPESILQKAYPQTKRTYLAFHDDSYSGCNLFALMTPASRKAPEFWIRVERERKRPWHIARAFGFINLLLFLSRRLSLSSAMIRASRVIGVDARATILSIAEAAIDVDKPADLELAESILVRQAAPQKAGNAQKTAVLGQVDSRA